MNTSTCCITRTLNNKHEIKDRIGRMDHCPSRPKTFLQSEHFVGLTLIGFLTGSDIIRMQLGDRQPVYHVSDLRPG